MAEKKEEIRPEALREERGEEVVTEREVGELGESGLAGGEEEGEEVPEV